MALIIQQIVDDILEELNLPTKERETDALMDLFGISYDDAKAYVDTYHKEKTGD